MKLAFDFMPLLVFFIAFKLQGIFVATAAVMIATTVQYAYVRRTGGTISGLQKFSLGLLLVLGGGALLFQDQRFLFFKPTLANCIIAGAALFSLYGARQPAAQVVFAEALGEQAAAVPARMWRRLTWQWVLFFLAEGILNLVVAFSFPLSFWVNFKVFGLTGLSMVMMVLQTVQLQPLLSPQPAKE